MSAAQAACHAPNYWNGQFCYYPPLLWGCTAVVGLLLGLLVLGLWWDCRHSLVEIEGPHYILDRWS
jgi:hypothetical protein